MRGREAKLNTCRGSTGCTKHVKGLKGLERNSIDIRAETRNHKVLDSSKGKVAHTNSQEG